jgi:hypothetical protein
MIDNMGRLGQAGYKQARSQKHCESLRTPGMGNKGVRASISEQMVRLRRQIKRLLVMKVHGWDSC